MKHDLRCFVAVDAVADPGLGSGQPPRRPLRPSRQVPQVQWILY